MKILLRGVEGGKLILKNGVEITIRNYRYAGGSATIKDIVKNSCKKTKCKKVYKNRIRRIKRKWPGIEIFYNKFGEPDFSKYAYDVDDILKNMDLTGIAGGDHALGAKALVDHFGEKEAARLQKKYALHHLSDTELQLVPHDIHDAFAHTGASSIMRQSKLAGMSGWFIYAFYPNTAEIIEACENGEDVTDEEIEEATAVDILENLNPYPMSVPTSRNGVTPPPSSGGSGIPGWNTLSW